jgi:hypothetical protein
MVALQEPVEQTVHLVDQRSAEAKLAEALQRCFVASLALPDLIQLPAYADINI